MKDQDVLTISELTRRIKCHLEAAFPFLKIQGEISNFKKQASGHLYFSLKDKDAQIAAVMFRNNAAKLTRLPKDGDKIVVDGEINIYPAGGRYQIIVKSIEQVGLGELLLRLEELKLKLHKLGWFSQKHKKPLPTFPKRIGVVTSPTGAAIQDILNILSRRFSGFHLTLYPVKVQGEGAAKEIAQAIDEMNRYQLVDVLIVGRGGGSIEDLFAFNEEIVASSIFKSQIPIISAVGHETDHCIADYVADVRAPTPSAAAEIVIAEKEQQIKHLNQMHQRIKREMQHQIRHYQSRLIGIKKQPIFLTPYTLLGPWMQKCDDLKSAIDQTMKQSLRSKIQLLTGTRQHVQALKPTAKISQFKRQLDQYQKGLKGSLSTGLINANKQLQEKKIILNRVYQQNCRLHQERFNHLIKSLKLIDPKNLLTKGYSILFSEKDHSVIKSVQEIEDNSSFIAQLADGKIVANIKEKIDE